MRTSSVARVAFLSAMTDGLAAVAGLVYVIVSTSLLYRYLGPVTFGVWATVFSLTAALAFMDFGLGNTAIGALARAVRRRSPTLVRTVLAALLAASAAVGGFLLVILLIALHFADVQALFSLTPDQRIPELRLFLQTYAFLLATNFVANALGQAARGFQIAWVFNLARLIGFLGATAGIAIGRWQEVTLPAFLLLSFGVQILCNAGICGAVLMQRTRHEGRVRAKRLLLFARRMMGTGSSFVLFNIARTFGWLLDYLIVARLMGAEAAGALAIIQRMFQIVSIGSSILSGALWPAYAYLVSGREWQRLKIVFAAGFAATVGYAAAMATLIFSFREEIAQWWLHTSVLALTPAYALYALWYCTEPAGSSFSILLNAKGIVTRQAVAACVFAGVSFCLKLWFVPTYGLVGLAGSTLAGYAIGFIVLMILIRNVRLFAGKAA